MKAAKRKPRPRPVVRFKFRNGSTADADLAQVYGIAQSQLSRYLRLEAQAGIERGKLGSGYGFKGGRPSAKPFNVDIQASYAALAQRHPEAIAASKLAKVLAGTHGVTERTARRWIAEALAQLPSR